jgi:hypothetical protein
MIDCSNQLFSNFASGEESNEEKDDEDNGEEADNQSEASNQADDVEEEEATAGESDQHQGVEQDIPRATMTTATKPPAGAPSSSPFNMNFFSPYILYTYIEEDVRMITIDFIVIGQSKSAYRPRVASDGHGFQLGMVVPNFFAQEDRLQAAHYTDTGFNEDTHKATALREIVAKYTDNLDAEEPLIGEPMQIKLPFKVEEEIVKWELLAFDNSHEFSEEIGNQQYYFVLTVDLVAVEKVKKEKKAPTFRMLGSAPTGSAHHTTARATSSLPSSLRTKLFGSPAPPTPAGKKTTK